MRSCFDGLVHAGHMQHALLTLDADGTTLFEAYQGGRAGW